MKDSRKYFLCLQYYISDNNGFKQYCDSIKITLTRLSYNSYNSCLHFYYLSQSSQLFLERVETKDCIEFSFCSFLNVNDNLQGLILTLSVYLISIHHQNGDSTLYRTYFSILTLILILISASLGVPINMLTMLPSNKIMHEEYTKHTCFINASLKLYNLLSDNGLNLPNCMAVTVHHPPLVANNAFPSRYTYNGYVDSVSNFTRLTICSNSYRNNRSFLLVKINFIATRNNYKNKIIMRAPRINGNSVSKKKRGVRFYNSNHA